MRLAAGLDKSSEDRDLLASHFFSCRGFCNWRSKFMLARDLHRALGGSCSFVTVIERAAGGVACGQLLANGAE